LRFTGLSNCHARKRKNVLSNINARKEENMNARKINSMLLEAEKSGKYLYALNLQVNSLGIIADYWVRVIGGKKLYGELRCRMLGQGMIWGKVISTTKFDIR